MTATPARAESAQQRQEAARRRARRRGSVLVLALLASASAAIAGMYLILVADLRVRKSTVLGRLEDAGRAARSGIELARLELGVNPGFTGLVFPGEDGGAAAGETGAAMVVSASSLGTLRSQVTSIATVGDATYTNKAELRAPPHPALTYNLFSATTIEFVEVALKGYARANGNVSASGRLDFFGALETTQGSTVTNQIPADQVKLVTSAIAAPALPVATYTSLAAELVNVPLDGARLLLERVALRPTSNPYGALSARGAYRLNAQGRDVVLRNVFIDGSLLIHGAGTVRVEEGYHHEAADPSLASLLVEGHLELRLENDLNEATLLFDFNGDGDLIDVHPAEVSGLTAVSGTFTGTYGGTLRGCVVANRLVLAGVPQIESSTDLAVQPVVGYTLAGPWNFQAGTIEGTR